MAFAEHTIDDEFEPRRGVRPPRTILRVQPPEPRVGRECVGEHRCRVGEVGSPGESHRGGVARCVDIRRSREQLIESGLIGDEAPHFGDPAVVESEDVAPVVLTRIAPRTAEKRTVAAIVSVFAMMSSPSSSQRSSGCILAPISQKTPS